MNLQRLAQNQPCSPPPFLTTPSEPYLPYSAGRSGRFLSRGVPSDEEP